MHTLEALEEEIRAILAGSRGVTYLVTLDEDDHEYVEDVQTIGQVRRNLGDCQRCALCKTRNRIVFGTGDPDADLMIIGEAPGEKEDLKGEPFVGPSGSLLDKMLTRVLGLQRADVYITNPLKCRPPDNRKPMPEEIEACVPFVRQQIRVVKPRLILIMGSIGTRAVLELDHGATRARQQRYEVEGVETYVTFHPAHLLHIRGSGDQRKREEQYRKSLVHDDLLLVKQRLQMLSSGDS